MTKTPADISRRRNIADAASGVPPRATVVLYARTGEQDVIAQLRRQAEARDWVVVGEITDTIPTDLPLQQCPGWPAVQAAILTHQARGIITTVDTDVTGLDGWLADHQAFVCQTAAAPQGATR
jgi:hypothetical protein